MVHYSYGKTPQGPCWVVESASTDFRGSRELLTYARNAAEYGDRLRTLLPLVEAEIVSRAGGTAVSTQDRLA
jgi:hypothetical protein